MKSISSNIIDLKYLSEKIIDLAYSALFLEDKNLIPLLRDLYREAITIEKETIKLIFKIKERDEDRLFLLDLVTFIRNEIEASLKIAELLEKYERFPYFIKEIFKETHKKVIVYRVTSKSRIKDLTIRDAEHFLPKSKIVAVKRAHIWLVKNFETKKLSVNDEVIIYYDRSYEKELFSLLHEK